MLGTQYQRKASRRQCGDRDRESEQDEREQESKSEQEPWMDAENKLDTESL